MSYTDKSWKGHSTGDITSTNVMALQYFLVIFTAIAKPPMA
ncbi:hypothetical protein ACEWA7_19975 [Vibrio parahaemolyticus]